MKHVLAVSTNTYHGFSLEEALKGISAAGFKSVELTAVMGWTEHVTASMSDKELDAVKEMLKKYDLSVIGLSGHANLMDEKRLADFRANMEMAAKFGAKFIITSTGEAHDHSDEAASEDGLVENLKSLIPDCERLGLTMVLETHGEYGLGVDLKRVVDAVGSKYLKVNYDTANVLFYGKKNPEDDIKECADAVGYVHLKDKGGKADEWDFPAPGKGWLKLEETLRYLDSQGFDGPISVEIEFTQEFTMNEKKPGDLEIVDNAVKDAYAYFKKLGYA